MITISDDSSTSQAIIFVLYNRQAECLISYRGTYLGRYALSDKGIGKADHRNSNIRNTALMLTNYFQVTDLATILIITPDGEAVNVFKGLTDLDTLSRAIDALI